MIIINKVNKYSTYRAVAGGTLHIVRVVSNVRVRSQSRRFSCCGIMHHFSRIKSRSFREISKEFLDSSDPIETLSRKFCGIFDCESRLVALASRHTRNFFLYTNILTSLARHRVHELYA